MFGQQVLMDRHDLDLFLFVMVHSHALRYQHQYLKFHNSHIYHLKKHQIHLQNQYQIHHFHWLFFQIYQLEFVVEYLDQGFFHINKIQVLVQLLPLNHFLLED